MENILSELARNVNFQKLKVGHDHDVSIIWNFWPFYHVIIWPFRLGLNILFLPFWLVALPYEIIWNFIPFWLEVFLIGASMILGTCLWPIGLFLAFWGLVFTGFDNEITQQPDGTYLNSRL